MTPTREHPSPSTPAQALAALRAATAAWKTSADTWEHTLHAAIDSGATSTDVARASGLSRTSVNYHLGIHPHADSPNRPHHALNDSD